MLEKIGKAFEVIGKLKTLPASERQWVLEEAFRTVNNNSLLAQHQSQSEDHAERLRGLERLRTLDVVRELLNTVEIRG